MTTQRIDADLLIPGSGEPVVNGTVVHADGRIRFAGPTAELTGDDRALTPTRVATLLPGLWDCHVHFAGIRGRVNTEELMLTPTALAVARSVKDAEAALRAGFTSLRDMGGHGCALAEAIREGTFAGPNIYSANQVIGQTGGHSDAHRLPHSWVTDPCRSGGTLRIADGVDECVRAVRLQLRAGAEVIKVCTSGGVLSELDNPRHQQYRSDELHAIVGEAARAERVVAAHCHGKAGIMAAIDAGCHTVEHGTELDEECAGLMAERGMVLVPTRTIYEALRGNAAALPPTWRDRFEIMAERHLQAIQLAHRTGVTIALGTDLGTSDRGGPLSWGQHASEFAHLSAAGLSPLAAIEAATANGPRTLGPRAPRSGELAPGHDADLLAVDADPLADITALADPDRIARVWKSGVLVHSGVPADVGRNA
ncbi:amidohydrolase family protein [Saccharopolyspora indica]|uniref:metal-dependent hydrolase family protein n=1 Tax=Saccharopolyspora indica TaxID=1229659 RepID=UPI0022EB92C3|nr:amidohydrolase family protein [Saccharopolyspora indica]MDA3648918.1 amidohydrolase family protein [Saccharopolyspora indica]